MHQIADLFNPLKEVTVAFVFYILIYLAFLLFVGIVWISKIDVILLSLS